MRRLMGEGLLDLLMVAATGEQAPQLLPPQGMTCEHKGNPQAAAHQCADISGIGVMGMDPVGSMLRLLQPFHQLIGKVIEVGPELLLAQVTAGSEGKATNGGSRCNRLLRPGVIQRDPSVVDQARDHLHPVHLGPGRQTFDQFEHVKGLATGVGITAKLEIVATEQSMEMEMQQPEAHAHLRCTTPDRPEGLNKG